MLPFLLLVLAQESPSFWLQYIVPILVAILGGVGTAFLGLRQFSGQVKSSDAATIFEAAEQLRAEMRAELAHFREENRKLADANERLASENGKLRLRIVELERVVDTLRQERR